MRGRGSPPTPNSIAIPQSDLSRLLCKGVEVVPARMHEVLERFKVCSLQFVILMVDHTDHSRKGVRLRELYRIQGQLVIG